MLTVNNKKLQGLILEAHKNNRESKAEKDKYKLGFANGIIHALNEVCVDRDIDINEKIDTDKYYKLTEIGRKKCEIYIADLKTKRKNILDAGIDTADETFVDYTPDEIFEDLLDFGIDTDGDIYNGYGVTDHYDADAPLGLTLGEDFIEDKQAEIELD